MANINSCTHIKVTGVRCGSPTLHGEQFCYFHQHAHRGVRKPKSRLHPIAILEDPESIQASLMEVVNGLMRNTLDTKRAELIIRALHIAMKNARNARFDRQVKPAVRDIPDFEAHDAARAKADAFVTEHIGTAAPGAEDALPAVAAIDPRPVDPNDPDFWERMERGGQILKREAEQRKAAEAARTAATVHVGTAAHGCPGGPAAPVRSVVDPKPAPAVPPHNFKPAPPMKTTAISAAADTKGKAKPPASAAPSPTTPDRRTRPSLPATPNKKPSASVPAREEVRIPAPKERKNAAQRASAG